MSMRAARQAASACSARAARRITSWCCPMPTRKRQRRSSPIRAFGCAGQRCLAVSVTVTVGEAEDWFPRSIAAAASGLKVGNGLDPATQMGPVITRASRERVNSLIGQGAGHGAQADRGRTRGLRRRQRIIRRAHGAGRTARDESADGDGDFRARALRGACRHSGGGDRDDRTLGLRKCELDLHLQRGGGAQVPQCGLRRATWG